MKNNIVNQSIKNTVFQYIGIALGFVTSGVLFPLLFSTEQIGLIGLLFGLTYIFSELCSFGMHNIMTKLFPFYRNYESQHHGFFFFLIIISSIGVLLAAFLLFIFKDVLIHIIFKNSILQEYYFLLYPLVLSTLLFNMFDNYLKVHYNISSASFLKDLLYRIILLFLLGLFYFKVFDFLALLHFIF
ncbi:MAG: hypothetical protein IPO21_19875 [Bacteroidales bacterium]|nr:hypothetical protein [Bacteroidales bacterium]